MPRIDQLVRTGAYVLISLDEVVYYGQRLGLKRPGTDLPVQHPVEHTVSPTVLLALRHAFPRRVHRADNAVSRRYECIKRVIRGSGPISRFAFPARLTRGLQRLRHAVQPVQIADSEAGGNPAASVVARTPIGGHGMRRLPSLLPTPVAGTTH
jgi:hypothetical protein